jgi:hypothetical protein
MHRSGPGRLAALGAALAVLTLAGCRDNPVGPSDHIHAEGFEIVLGQEVLLRVLHGVPTGAGLAVAAGAELGPLAVHFLDQAGQRIVPGAAFYLEIAATNPAVAVFEPTTAGAFQGRIRGLAAGTATLQVRLMHGRVGRGHADFVGTAQVAVGG